MPRPFTFVHAADLHLGTPFQGIGHASPEAARLLRDATLDALDGLAALCIEERAAFLLLAGDIYDGAEHTVRARVRFFSAVERLGRAGVTVFAAAGNHDPLGGDWSAGSPPPENLHLFPPRPTAFPVRREGELIALVHGASYPRREVTEDLSADFHRSAEKVFQAGVLHATVGAPPGHAPYAPTTLERLAATGLDYWALGHVHTRAVLRAGDPCVVYPGNLQALSPRERGARGAYVVAVDGEGRAAPPRFVALDRVRFAEARVEPGELASPADLVPLLREKARTLREEAEGRALVLTLALEGSTPLHAALARPAALGDLLESLRDEAAGAEPLLWWNRIENRTRPALEVGRLRGQETLEGALIGAADALAADPDALARFAAEAWSDLESRADAARLGEPPDDAERAALLDEALFLLLDRLRGEEAS